MADPVLVRATIKLPGLACGQEAMVDPEIPYMANALKMGALIRLDGKGGQVAAAEDEPEAGDTDPAPEVQPHESTPDHDETGAVVPPDLLPPDGQ